MKWKQSGTTAIRPRHHAVGTVDFQVEMHKNTKDVDLKYYYQTKKTEPIIRDARITQT